MDEPEEGQEEEQPLREEDVTRADKLDDQVQEGEGLSNGEDAEEGAEE